MTKSINTSSIEKATNKSWKQWVSELDNSGARELSHTELARKLYDELDGKLDSHGWWAQGITVAYEQHIGKRVPGQLSNGLFELAISKTVAAPRAAFFAHIVEWFENQAILNGHEVLRPRSSETPKRSNWRCDFADGSKFTATVEGDEKVKLILAHTAVPNQRDSDNWRTYWKQVADKLADL